VSWHPTTQELDGVLAVLKRRTRKDWAVLEHLGGRSEGAFLVAAGRKRAVLKISPDPAWRARLAAAAPTLDRARAAGWPAPRWLGWGSSGDRHFLLQDFVDGDCLENRPFEEAHVEAVIALNESQNGLAPSQAARPSDTGSHGGGDFSARARALLFEPSHPARAELRRHSARAAAALAELEARLAGMEDVATRRDDLVHGDFYQGQLLARGGEVVAVIDVESLGRGCRSYDLATFVIAAGWFEAETAAVDRVARRGAQIAGRDAFRLHLAANIVFYAWGGMANWPAGSVEPFIESRLPLLDPE
jgi:aminoglycoside phosphotransferase (APT) family kinase protein